MKIYDGDVFLLWIQNEINIEKWTVYSKFPVTKYWNNINK